MTSAGKSRRFVRPAFIASVASALLLFVALPALAGITWSPSSSARVTNRPRTCNTPASTCTDSAFSYDEGPNSLAVSNNGTTHYLHSIWVSDKPSGDSSNGYAAYDASCATKTDPATGSPPYCPGVYYARSSDDGATWNGGAAGTDAVRIGSGTVDNQRGSVSASGAYVYVAYVQTAGYWNQMCAKSARVMYLAVNSNYGAAGAWSAPLQISSTGGRVDYPSIWAQGNDVYLAYTNSNSGQIVFAHSTDHGTSFQSQGIGFTTNTYDNQISPGNGKCSNPPSPNGLEGFDGAPAIAGNGSTVGAIWVRDATGKVAAKISPDDGTTWPGTTNGQACSVGFGACTQNLSSSGALGPSGSNHQAEQRGSVDVAAASGRIVFAWVDNTGAAVPKGVYTRTYAESGGWGVSHLISCLQTTSPCTAAPAPLIFNEAFAPSVALYGTLGIGVAWSACPYTPTAPTTPCDDKTGGSSADPGAEVLYKESWDGGSIWWAGVSGSYGLIADNSATNSEVNEFPTLVFDKPGAASSGCAPGTMGPEVGCERYVDFTGRSHSFFDYIDYIDVGTET